MEWTAAGNAVLPLDFSKAIHLWNIFKYKLEL
jgi:hypothetical protein